MARKRLHSFLRELACRQKFKGNKAANIKYKHACQMGCCVLACSLTKHLAIIVEGQNPQIDEFYAVQKRR